MLGFVFSLRALCVLGEVRRLTWMERVERENESKCGHDDPAGAQMHLHLITKDNLETETTFR